MPVPSLSAARTACEMRDWSISNLQLQKILYIAQMFHLGETGQPLLDEAFEAWEYGPVLPRVYSRARTFGSGPVRNVFHWESSVPANTSEHQMLAEAIKATAKMNAAKLVSITHWDKGAWAKCYRPDTRGIIIPNSLILEEFRERKAA